MPSTALHLLYPTFIPSPPRSWRDSCPLTSSSFSFNVAPVCWIAQRANYAYFIGCYKTIRILFFPLLFIPSIHDLSQVAFHLNNIRSRKIHHRTSGTYKENMKQTKISVSRLVIQEYVYVLYVYLYTYPYVYMYISTLSLLE